MKYSAHNIEKIPIHTGMALAGLVLVAIAVAGAIIMLIRL